MTMSARQRVQAALEHRQPDRTPIFEYVLLSPLADRLLGRVYGGDPANWPDIERELGWQGAVQRSAIDQLDLACLLGHDMLYVCPNVCPNVGPNPLPVAPASAPAPAAAESGPVERLQRRNALSAAAPAAPADDSLLVYVVLKQEMARRGLDLPIVAPAYAHGIWTDTDLMETILLAPEVAHEHFEQATRHSLARIDCYLALGIDQIGIGGDMAGNKPLISPRCYREFIMPQVRTLARRIHTGRAWAINASDGNLWPMIDDFLLGCEVDGYLEIDMQAGMDMRRLKAAYGARVTLYGNLDCGTILSFATPDEIRRQTLDCIEAGWGDGGHILCVSNAITASVPLGNYLAIVQAYRDRFGLPAMRIGAGGER